jgi:hypothetical protein
MLTLIIFDPPKCVYVYIYNFRKQLAPTVADLQSFLNYGNTSIAWNAITIPESGSLNVNPYKFLLKKNEISFMESHY